VPVRDRQTDRQTRMKITALQVCNRANRQRSDSIGRTVLQTVAKKCSTLARMCLQANSKSYMAHNFSCYSQDERLFSARGSRVWWNSGDILETCRIAKWLLQEVMAYRTVPFAAGPYTFIVYQRRCRYLNCYYRLVLYVHVLDPILVQWADILELALVL